MNFAGRILYALDVFFKVINKKNFLFNCLFLSSARLAVNDLVPFIAPAFRVVSPSVSIVRGQIR